MKSDSYASWELAIAALREMAVRRREVMPVNEIERIQREQGPVPVWEMDCVRTAPIHGKTK